MDKIIQNVSTISSTIPSTIPSMISSQSPILISKITKNFSNSSLYIEKTFPRIIHQVFGFWDNHIPKNIQSRMDTWKQLHPTFEYMLWNKKNSREFLKKYYSWFLLMYDTYQYEIQRADAIRYFILYHYGGIYSDIDLEPVKSIEPLLKKYEESYDAILYRSPNSELLTNDFMVSKPHNVFWKRVWYALIEHSKFSSMSKHLTVMHTTGPLLLDEVYENFNFKKRSKLIRIVHAMYINNCDISQEKPCANKEAYMKRYEGNSWHAMDSSIINLVYKNWWYILIGLAIIIISIIIFLRNNAINNTINNTINDTINNTINNTIDTIETV
jgi:inositol phosphorylceramide mannosyltransferase catalytic subunit